MKFVILMAKIFPPNSKTAQLKQIDPVTLVSNLVQQLMYLPVMILFII